MGNVITAPLEVLHLAGMCDAGIRASRFDLTRLQIGRDDESCWAVATDSKRLAVARWDPAPEDAPPATEFGVPGLCAKLILRAATKPPLRKLTLAIAMSKGTIRAISGGLAVIDVSSPLPERRFPLWKEIMKPHLERVKRPITDEDGRLLNSNLLDGIPQMYAAIQGSSDYPHVEMSLSPCGSSPGTAWLWEWHAGKDEQLRGLHVWTILMTLAAGTAITRP